MKWLTRGGVIAEVDMRKLVAAFTLVLEQADKYGVDVVLGMRPFHYMSSTRNFRRLAERPRLGPVEGPVVAGGQCADR